MVRVLSAIAVLSVSVGVGYAVGVREPAAQPMAALSAPMPDESHSSAPASLVPAGRVTSVSAALAMLKPTGFKETRLFEVLGEDEAGIRLRSYLVAMRHAREIPGVETYVKDFIAELKGNPGAGAALLERGLSRVDGQEFPLERSSLMKMLADLPGQADVAKSIALSELTQNIVPAGPDPRLARSEEELNAALSTTPNMIPPQIAQSILVKYAESPEEALQNTVAGILAQPDLRIRTNLAGQFNQAFPNMSAALASSLASNGVTLPSAEPPDPRPRVSAAIMAKMRNAVAATPAPPGMRFRMPASLPPGVTQ